MDKTKTLNIKGPVLVIGFISDSPDTEEFSWSRQHDAIESMTAQQVAEWLADMASSKTVKHPLPTTMLIVQNDAVQLYLSQAAGDFGEG